MLFKKRKIDESMHAVLESAKTTRNQHIALMGNVRALMRKLLSKSWGQKISGGLKTIIRIRGLCL